MNIYLDIDGVLVTKDHKGAKFAHEFISYTLQHYPDSTYWLSTRCQGDASKTVAGIADLYNDKTVELLHQIQPTTWLDSPLKTSAIDFSQPFLWFDDYVFDADKKVLLENNALDNWIKVDLVKNPGQLMDFVDDFPLPIGH